ncbi:CHASE2 domain-containing protein [Candidatus Solirubrobacter pratensis]|uniref:CHASE2 domain-containing protein n=1 Tax=Candidatus Solirubrobacter pratensis TaxID=1298857 RepID=UPI0004032A22|nr:adenylate/guanylate cyclase domain-containing protein [Candidatus Solirubrobacter pratensis]
MKRRTRRIRTFLLLASALLIAAVGIVTQQTDALRRLEYSSINKRFDIRGSQGAPKDVAVVAIEDKTFEQLNQQWPFDRTTHARVIEQLTKAGAKVIAYDVQFTEAQSSGDPDKDQAADNRLIEAVRAQHKGANRMVMATTEVTPDGKTRIFGGDEGLAYSRATPSNSNYVNDNDGRIRHMAFKIDGLETFPVAAARAERGGKLDLPPGNQAWIDYPGKPRTIRYLSFVDVMRGKFDPAAVRGKLVVVGAIAPSLQDLHPTSTTGSGLMPGPEIQAAAAWTALEGFPLRDGRTWLDILLVVALALITPLLALRFNILVPVLGGLVAIAAVLVGVQIAFDHGTVITEIYAVLAGIVAIIATGAIHGVTVAFEREQARDAFARFVPEAVVDQVLRDAGGVRLGGVRREGTVMFSDLRGFTSFSETLEPEQVIEALNMYLTEMSEAILDHGGTLVAYMGDGIMAVFGAPLQQDDHADRALEAARDMLSRMERFNDYLRGQRLHEGGFKMGIGLNSGPVMSGNVGSERRLEYTALGDTTNTAARLEGMTKGTPHQLFVADTTRGMLTRPAEDLIQVGEAEVRGRVAKVMLWSLADQPPPPRDPGVPVEAASQP